MFPLDLTPLLGKAGATLVLLLIGTGFGWVLESAGFGDSRRLAGQFYFRDLAVLRVMFTAIVCAMLLVFWATALGWLSYEDLWVNPTYWWPGILGGLVMGVGFILGGYCPGTSLVSLATFKLDGLFFVLGALTGITVFGETADGIAAFANSGYAGRLTLQDLAGVDAGWVALAVVLMALGMFWGANRLKDWVTGQREPRTRLAAAGPWLLLAAAAGLVLVGQPGLAERWERLEEAHAKLEGRQVQIQAAELASLMQDPTINLLVLDVRGEADYNLFHLRGARRLDDSLAAALAKGGLPEGSVLVLTGNGEGRATQVWQQLQVLRVPNVYLLEGGLNHWLALFGRGLQPLSAGPDEPAWRLPSALGERHEAAWPDLHHSPLPDFEHRVKLGAAGHKSGGCG